MAFLLVKYVWMQWHSMKPSVVTVTFFQIPKGVNVSEYVCIPVQDCTEQCPSPHWYYLTVQVAFLVSPPSRSTHHVCGLIREGRPACPPWPAPPRVVCGHGNGKVGRETAKNRPGKLGYPRLLPLSSSNYPWVSSNEEQRLYSLESLLITKFSLISKYILHTASRMT